MKSLVQRYLIAAVGFCVAAAWFGVALERGLECLLAFLLTLLVVTVVQRRRRVAQRHVRHREAADPGARRQSRRPPPHSRPSRTLYDDENDGGDWPRLAERHW